jgi:hypothetical protein
MNNHKIFRLWENSGFDSYLFNSSVHITGDFKEIKMVSSFLIQVTGFKSGYIFFWEGMFTKSI